MRKGTNLGTIVPVVENFQEYIQMLSHDAEVLGKDIQEILYDCDLRIGYDREVLLLLISNLSAAIVSTLENFDPSYAASFKSMYKFHLKEYRRIKNEKRNNKH